MQKNGKKVLSVCGVATLLIAGTALPSTVKADSSSRVNRLGGQDRYETAAKVAQDGWTSSDYAIVANGEGYADALCAAPLAKEKNAPILLTAGNSLNQNALNQLKDLNVNHVIVVGGTGVVPESVLNEIKAQVPDVQDVQRLGGQDRYETSVRIAEALKTKPVKAVVASGEGFADALSAGPSAAINGMPILLTKQNSLPDAEANYLKANSSITETYVIGGTGSVSDSVKNLFTSPKRLGGADRYETNTAVLKEFVSSFNFGNIYAALGKGPIGNEFADALTGSALAAKNKNPLIITGYTLSSSTKDFLDENVPKNSTLTVLGGTGNISDSLADEIKDAFGKASNGGGGGGSTTATDITADIVKYYGPKIQDTIASNPDLGKYYDVDTTDSITLKVKGSYEDKITTVQDIFNNVDKADVGDINTPGTIAYRVQKIYDLASAHVNAAKIDGKTFQDFLIAEKAKDSKFSQYIKDGGSIDVQLVAQKIKNKEIDYDSYTAFITSLESAIKDSVNLSNPSPTIAIKGTPFSINRIEQDNKVLYDSSLSREVNIDDILGVTSTVGTFKVYVDNGNSYFYITIQG
ncbi:cell wall-binding repeat-containing protein [Clostridium sp. HV4-5-A1G]|uniref:cell wall-binding repeat-containing protein n=1 Tax=Clostridium sp. HV4-5-A1G TaxID=2004595 RepID=UPI0016877C38|nr:cell wall-binding repeat-containing protein [Clostridium sp. HV4-5-A1G]